MLACVGLETCTMDPIGNEWVAYTQESIDSGCYEEDALFFIQVSCEQTEEHLSEKIGQAWITILAGIVGSFLYIFVLMRQLRVLDRKKGEWDVSTVTAGDYTVEFEISEDFFNKWKEDMFDVSKGKSVGESFKTFLKSEIEQQLLSDELKSRLTKSPGKGDANKERFNIAIIQFAFDNAELIAILEARGKAIKKPDFAEV
jgi:hypothetical protein